MRALYAGPLAIGIIVWHIVTSWTVRLFLRDPLRLRRYLLRTVALHGKWLLRVLDIEVILENDSRAQPEKNYFIVANHMSYLDAPILAAFRPGAFVTSMEMRAVPVLGLITELGGCLYVERRSREKIQNEISSIETALKQGFNVIVFPEATSTNGEKVLQFKRPLFAAAIKTGTPVLPIVIQYESINGVPVTVANRDSLCWYGDMSFGPHFIGLLAQKKIKVRIKILPEIPVTENSCRDRLMDASFALVTKNYQPIR